MHPVSIKLNIKKRNAIKLNIKKRKAKGKKRARKKDQKRFAKINVDEKTEKTAFKKQSDYVVGKNHPPLMLQNSFFAVPVLVGRKSAQKRNWLAVPKGLRK